MEGIWYMAVYKDKNKSTWYVSKRYTDWDGSKKRLFKRGFQTKREALEYELSFVSKISDNQKMLFKDFIPIYYEDLEKRVRKNTMITKKNIIEIKIRPYFDELRLCDITPKEVMRWQNQMLDGKKKNGKSYAGDTLIKMHAQLSAILNHACKYYGLRTNAAAQTGCFKVKTKKEQQFWTLDEYRKFVDAVSDKTLSYICFEVLFWCGLRLGDDDDKIRLNQRKPSKYKGLRRFGPEKNLQRINKFMKERPIFYKNLIQMKENIRFYLRCFYCITKVMILQFNSENRTELARNG